MKGVEGVREWLQSSLSIYILAHISDEAPSAEMASDAISMRAEMRPLKMQSPRVELQHELQSLK